ncbi:hypothetical protein [Amycolatopsis methanolica]|uniref:hypothetical protein n=1 Tax=Amycolatopsis methanolica TaxID=1814 RepID=UPI0034365122
MRELAALVLSRPERSTASEPSAGGAIRKIAGTGRTSIQVLRAGPCMGPLWVAAASARATSTDRDRLEQQDDGAE